MLDSIGEISDIYSTLNNKLTTQKNQLEGISKKLTKPFGVVIVYNTFQ